MELRPYQQECVETINNLPEGTKTIACLATGLGKTVVGANLEFKGRVLWLSHRDELVRQPEKYFTGLGYTYGIEKANEHANGESVVSASIQSICRDERLKNFKEDEFDTIICDEAQHAAAPSYRKVLSYFKPRKLIGLTATPNRDDGVRLSDVFDSICFVRDLRWGIEHGYLARIRCLQVLSDYDMDNVEKSLGDYTAGSLGHEMEFSNNSVVVTKAYMEHCLPEKRQTLIYCPTVKSSENVAKTIKTALPKKERGTIAVLSDRVSPEDRKKILEKYRKGKIRCIVNCMILTEGTDLPETSCIINNRPTAKSSLYQQIVGRGTRLSEGKEYCLVIDIVGENYEKKNICTAPTLFGIEPNFLPKDVQTKIQNEDLLEISDAIIQQQAEAAKNASLIQQVIDIFSEEQLNLIKNNSRKGLAGIAAKYSDHVEKGRSEEYDFGDLYVKRMPFDSHYYRIDATYDGRIFFSKPDMVGNTVLDVNISGLGNSVPGGKISFISDPMPMEEAISFVSKLLDSMIPNMYRAKWSKLAREKLGRLPVTERQATRVAKDFKEYLPNCAFQARALNMLQASDLIDMKMDMDSVAKDKKKQEEIAKEATVLRIGKEREDWEKTQEERRKNVEKEENKRKEAWPEYREIVEQRYEAVVAAINSQVSSEEQLIGKTGNIIVEIDYSFYRIGIMPSAKQLLFLGSLVEDVRDMGVIFNANILRAGLDMWHTGLLIAFCLSIKKNVHAVKHVHILFDAQKYIDTIRNVGLEKSQRDDDEVKCDYTYVKKSLNIFGESVYESPFLINYP